MRVVSRPSGWLLLGLVAAALSSPSALAVTYPDTRALTFETKTVTGAVFAITAASTDLVYVSASGKIERRNPSTGATVASVAALDVGASGPETWNTMATSFSNVVDGSFFFCIPATSSSYRYDTATHKITRMTGDGTSGVINEGTGALGRFVCSQDAHSSSQIPDGSATYMMSESDAASITYIIKVVASKSTAVNQGEVVKVAGDGTRGHSDIGVGQFQNVFGLSLLKDGANTPYLLVVGADTSGPIRYVNLKESAPTVGTVPVTYNADATQFADGEDAAAIVGNIADCKAFVTGNLALCATVEKKLFRLSWQDAFAKAHLHYGTSPTVVEPVGVALTNDMKTGYVASNGGELYVIATGEEYVAPVPPPTNPSVNNQSFITTTAIPGVNTTFLDAAVSPATTAITALVGVVTTAVFSMLF